MTTQNDTNKFEAKSVSQSAYELRKENAMGNMKNQSRNLEAIFGKPSDSFVCIAKNDLSTTICKS